MTSVGNAISSPAVRAASTRAVVTPVSAILSLLAARMTLDHYGLAAFGALSLILALPALLPSRDLGFGAKVVDAVARRDEVGRAAVTSAVGGAVGRVGRVGACLACGICVLEATAGWRWLLGGTVAGVPGWAITVVGALFAAGLPGGLGVSVFWGLQRLDVVALQAPLLTLGTCIGVIVGVTNGFPLWVALVVSSAANCATQWCCLFAALRRLAIGTAELVPYVRGPARGAFRGWAAPMFVISAAGSIAYQTDRVVLSHVADAYTVARYSVASQAYLPVLGLITSAGYTLWPRFAVERARDEEMRRRFAATAWRYAVCGACGALLLVAAGPVLVSRLLHVSASPGLFFAFAALLGLQAVGLPFGMFLTDKAGLRFQARLFGTMVCANLALSVLFARWMGAPGPVVASVLTYGLIVLVPSVVRTTARLKPAR